MEIILETERLILREFNEDDAQFFYELNSDPDVVKYTGDVAFESVESARVFIKNYSQYRKFGYGRWLVVLKGTEGQGARSIRFCGLKNNGSYIDLGYRFLRSEWGKGYASEASIACLKYGFEKLNMTEIQGRVANDNVASIKVLEKIGMKYYHDDNEDDMGDIKVYKYMIYEFNAL